MKYILFILLLISSNNLKGQQYNIVTKLSKYNFNLTDSIPKEYRTISRLGKNLLQSVCGIVLYTVEGKEHLVIVPSDDSIPGPSLHFIKKNNKWIYESYYSDVLLDGVRNYSFMDNKGTIAFAQHGTEAIHPWPLGDIIIMKTNEGKLTWEKISKNKAFFHSVASGDMNNDGLIDVVGMHMGTDQQGWWGVQGFIPYTQNMNNEFDENKDIIIDPDLDGSWKGNHHSGAILLADIVGDKMPELIKADYGQNSQFPSLRYSFAIFKYDPQVKKYRFLKENQEKGVFSIPEQGATSIKAADFNNDGFIDLAIASEGKTENSPDGGYVEIWTNDGNANFKPTQSIECPVDSFGFREFEVADLNKDGWQDIFLHGKEHYKISEKNNKLLLNKAIWMNEKGKFKQLENEIKINRSTTPDSNFWNVGSIKGFLLNDQLIIVGFEKNCNTNGCNDLSTEAFNLYEISVRFCNNLIKPQFNLANFSFCAGDSLKLSVTNLNKGDTLKWYFGTKSDLTNISSKIFTDSTKLFVTRTDSVGCIISSDTIQISKLSIPPSPILTRDAENNLTANINNITWYKDGVKISDTSQKIKPTVNGYYTATTTQNGCKSALSTSYYYLTTSVSNLSNDEYFRISPNPTNGEIFLNYNIGSTKDVYINLIDANGRIIINNRKVTNGSKLNIGSLGTENYYLQAKDKTGRLLVIEKLIKN